MARRVSHPGRDPHPALPWHSSRWPKAARSATDPVPRPGADACRLRTYVQTAPIAADPTSFVYFASTPEV